MSFKIAIFFVKRLLFPVIFGVASCVVLAILFTVFSEKLYNFISVITIMIFCMGSFMSSKICTSGIKRFRLLLSLLCSLTFSAFSFSIFSYIFHNFKFSNFLIKSLLATIFGFLGLLKLKKNVRYSRNKGVVKNK